MKVKEGVFYQQPRKENIEELIKRIKEIGPDSVGISLCNSYLSPYAENELA